MTNFQLADSQETIHVDVRQLIIAGWQDGCSRPSMNTSKS